MASLNSCLFTGRANNGMIKLLICCYLAYPPSSFLPFLITSTAVEGGKIVVADTFLASFLGFFDSLCLKSLFPMMTPLSECWATKGYKSKFNKRRLLCKVG